MGTNSAISWCDHTWNPWFGCSEVSPACDYCYARVMMAERYGRVGWGAGEDRKRTSAETWRAPFRWDRAAAKAGKRATVFCLSLGDIWDNEVDPLWRRQAFDVMESTPHLVYLLLSKRIGNAVSMCDPLAGNPSLPPNAALGATMVNQTEWDRDWPKLKEAARILAPLFTFTSIEPMLGPIDMRGDLPGWAIVGGESGAHARPMHPRWASDIRDQCANAGVSFHFKQWGEWGETHPNWPKAIPTVMADDGTLYKASDLAYPDGPRYGEAIRAGHDKARLTNIYRTGKHRAGRLLEGVAHDGLPPLEAMS